MESPTCAHVISLPNGGAPQVVEQLTAAGVARVHRDETIARPDDGKCGALELELRPALLRDPKKHIDIIVRELRKPFTFPFVVHYFRR